MSQGILSLDGIGAAEGQVVQKIDGERPEQITSAELAASITRAASTQTYFTIRFLVDGPLEADAFRAYAYFRWVDDVLDEGQLAQADRLAFLSRQQVIIGRCYRGERPDDLCQEERLVADLIDHDQGGSSGLRIYIEQMMAVMAFDAGRNGDYCSEAALAQYTHSLAVAVTEALHYFIGHGDFSPQDETRYLAVTGAHISHMLRDALADAESGYSNIPKSFLEMHGIGPAEVNHEAYRAWVAGQVKDARRCFAAGRAYLARVENPRCRLAGYAYIARFEFVLEAIEKEGYLLRAAYPERKSKRARVKMGLAVLKQVIQSGFPSRPAPRMEMASSLEMIKWVW